MQAVAYLCFAYYVLHKVQVITYTCILSTFQNYYIPVNWYFF